MVLVLLLALAQTQGDPAVKLERAQALASAGRFREALPLYEELAKALPGDARPLAGMGATQMGLRRPALAIAPLEKAIARDPGNAQTRLLLAEALLETERYEQAAVQLRKATDVSPSSAHAWYTLGRTWVALASAAYGELLSKAAQDSPYALAVTADGLMRRQQYPHAVVAFRKALAQEPNLAAAHAAIAEIYRRIGRTDWAAREQTSISALDCSSRQTECACLAGRYDEALAALHSQQTLAALYWRGQAYTGLADQAFAKLAQLPPSVELHRYRAGLHWDAGRRLETVQELREALKLAPNDRQLRRDLGMALGAAGFYEEAYRLASDLLRAEPGSASLNALAGDALLNTQKAEGAVPFLKKSVALEPRNPAAQASLGRAYMQTGDAKLALPHLKAAAAADPDGSVHHLLARAYRQTGQPELAAAAMAKYQELSAKSAVAPPQLDISPP